MQKLGILLVITLLSVLATSPAVADDAVIFDSGPLIVNPWHVHLSTHTVAASQLSNGALHIAKNPPGSGMRAGILVLNNRLVPLTRFLAGSESTFDKQIQLRPTNRLKVLLIGKPGASLAITIHGDNENQPPTVMLSAQPATVDRGSSSTLSWSSTHADACRIEPDVGDVDQHGSIAVSPAQTTTYTIAASGPGGMSSDAAIITVVNPISLQIISPSDGESIKRPDVMVRGTLVNAAGKEIGITVNGKAAMVYDNHFVANHVPLKEGDNTLDVRATGSFGDAIEETIMVYSENREKYIVLSVDADSGIRPFETRLRINGSLNTLPPAITYTGPGAVIFQESAEDNEYPVRLEQEGIYYFTAEVFDDQGNAYRDTQAVVVMSADELDELLKGKWAGMKTALMAGDIDTALKFHHQRYHAKYTAIYNALGVDLPTLVEQMQDISWIGYTDGTAKYRIHQNHAIGGQVVAVTYYVYFSRGRNGLWQIDRY
jgi:hypothetical protein